MWIPNDGTFSVKTQNIPSFGLDIKPYISAIPQSISLLTEFSRTLMSPIPSLPKPWSTLRLSKRAGAGYAQGFGIDAAPRYPQWIKRFVRHFRKRHFVVQREIAVACRRSGVPGTPSAPARCVPAGTPGPYPTDRGIGTTFQMVFAYWPIVRSEENWPIPATFRMAF